MHTATANVIHAVHECPARWVLAVTGGGASAAGDLLSVPGGSRTLLEIVVPYSEPALAEFLAYRPDNSCSASISEAMARRALARAQWLAPGEPVFGLGCTASLVSDRPKRGDHRVHVSTVGRDQLRTWSLTLTKGARDRLGEERVAAALMLEAMAQTLGLPTAAIVLQPGEQIEEATGQAASWPAYLEKNGAVLMEADGRISPDAVWDPAHPAVLVCGAFNPLHEAHLALADLAERLEGKPAAFELSVTNVDKPELIPEEVRRRLAQFVGQAPVWLTRAPRFQDKAALFPEATFVVGADTATRLLQPRYYENDERRLLHAFDCIRQQRCRFLVAGRVDATGRYIGMADIPISEEYRELFRAISAADFRMDVSSTQLREIGYCKSEK